MSNLSATAARNAGRNHEPAAAAETPLLIDFDTYDRLQALATRSDRLPEVTAELLQELERARLVPAAQLPDDAVRVGSRVTYQDEASGAIRTIDLVWPAQADVPSMRISVLTPIGAALIGLAAGQSIAWTARDGKKHVLTVTAVEQAEPALAAS
jgi:regulator of nucleoside diphosphate kinase